MAASLKICHQHQSSVTNDFKLPPTLSRHHHDVTNITRCHQYHSMSSTSLDVTECNECYVWSRHGLWSEFVRARVFFSLVPRRMAVLRCKNEVLSFVGSSGGIGYGHSFVLDIFRKNWFSTWAQLVMKVLFDNRNSLDYNSVEFMVSQSNKGVI